MAGSPSDALALSNCLAVHPSDFAQGTHVLVNDAFALTVRYARNYNLLTFVYFEYSHDNTGKLQPGTIGASQPQRQWIGLSLTGDQASVEPLPSPPHAGAPGFIQAIDIEVGFLKRNIDIAEVYSADDMSKNFIKAFNGILMTVDQTIVFEYHGQNLKGSVKSVALMEVPGNPPPLMRSTGIIFAETDVTLLKAPDSPIKIKSSAKKLVGSQFYLSNTKYSITELLQMLFLHRTSSSRTWE